MEQTIGVVAIQEKDFTIGGKVFLLRELSLRKYNQVVKFLHGVQVAIREELERVQADREMVLTAADKTEVTNAIWAEKNVTAEIAALVLEPKEREEIDYREFFLDVPEKNAVIEAVNFFMVGEGNSLSTAVLTLIFSPKRNESLEEQSKN